MLRAAGRLALRNTHTPAVHLLARSLSVKSGTTSEDGGKIYDLRTITTQPGRLGDVVQLIGENIHLLKAHSKLIGYWITEMGAANELIHLWEYDNYGHRAAALEAIRKDEDLKEKMASKLMPVLASQTSTILNSFPWYPPKLEPCNHGVYELVTQTVKLGLLPQWEHRVLQGLPARLALDYPHPLGFFYSEFGSLSTVYHFWPHENFDKRVKHRRELFEVEEWKETSRDTMPFMDSIQIKGLLPTYFSPLQ